ncbi:helix-turn-helix domain-containing protein [Numidum massiliense]|nr:helix-turn-helix transcriptional regulator [Numidum massiliense]
MRQWLVDTRKSKGLTQQHVACLASISRSYYLQIESGSKNPG